MKASLLGGFLMAGAIFGLQGVVIAMVGVTIGSLIRVSQRLERIEARLA
jgi:hypothetical protein